MAGLDGASNDEKNFLHKLVKLIWCVIRNIVNIYLRFFRNSLNCLILNRYEKFKSKNITLILLKIIKVIKRVKNGVG